MSGRGGRTERRARARKERRRAKGPEPSGDGRRKLALPIGLAIAAAAGITWTIAQREPAPVPPPPPVTYRIGEGDARIAVFDVDALRAWCAEESLPEPPGIPEAEAEFATAYLDALHAAARERSAETFGLVGMICESIDSHGAARAYFDLAQEKDPSDHRWPYYLACIDQITGETDAAAERFRRVLQLDPEYPTTYARLGQIELDRGRLDAADSLFAQYTRRAPGDYLGLVGSGRVALARGDAEGALALLERAVARGGDDFQVHRVLGTILSRLGHREEAERRFARSAELPQGAWFRARDPLDQALHGSGSAVAAMEVEFERRSGSQDWAELARLAEEILRRRAADVTMMGNLASLYRKLGRFDDAHALLDRAFPIGIDTLRLHMLRAEVALGEHDFPRALAAAEEAVRLDPESARAHGVRARALLMLQRPAEAVAAMERSLQLQPGDPTNLQVLGEAFLAQGDLEGAQRAYRASLEIADSEIARQRLAQLAQKRTLEGDSR